jgi:transketolase
MDVKVMRDVLIEEIHKRMAGDESIYFVSADFGSPALDKLREEFSDRFINVGIAEQNLINVSAGLALEGATVYAYAIAPFLTMRAYEQIRINLSMLSQMREINVNMIGVGAGLSYDVTGPTHHCLEDIAIMQVLPNLVIFSPSDYVTAARFVDYSLHVKKPKYIRLDGKAQPRIYRDEQQTVMEDGFFALKDGREVCVVSTGYMTHKALKVAERLAGDAVHVGVVDIFMLKPLNTRLLYETLKKYRHLITMEEAFISKGSMQTIVTNAFRESGIRPEVTSLGFKDSYIFDVGDREHLHKLNGLNTERVVQMITQMVHPPERSLDYRGNPS